jgi:hypothetical protein
VTGQQWRLLNYLEIMAAGDERYVERVRTWEPIPTDWVGQPYVNNSPCRRPIPPPSQGEAPSRPALDDRNAMWGWARKTRAWTEPFCLDKLIAILRAWEKARPTPTPTQAPASTLRGELEALLRERPVFWDAELRLILAKHYGEPNA